MTATDFRPRHLSAAKRIRSSKAGGGGGYLATAMGTVRAVLIAVAAAVGLACLVVVALPLVGMQLVVLTTGSMSPGLPAGSLVVARDVAASELLVGDIVTVGREGQPPVTHRIIAIEPTTSLLGERVISLQGDANADPDPEPYVVDRVGEAVFSLPWGGQFVFGMRSPWAIGGATVAIAVLTLWAWWPQPE